MKNIIWFALVAFALTTVSCENEEVQEELVSTKLIGEWQMYRNEDLEAIIDQFTGTEWTTKDKWFRTIRNDSQIIIEFKADGTFVTRYASVETGNGVWGELEDGRYYFEHAAGVNNERDGLHLKRYITFYCDNTYSVEIGENKRAISYYKIIGTTECAADITYKVLDTED